MHSSKWTYKKIKLLAGYNIHAISNNIENQWKCFVSAYRIRLPYILIS